VQRYIGGLPGGQAQRAGDPGIRPPAGRVERRVAKGIEPKSQTSIVFPAERALSLEQRWILSALGDVLEIRLREELREELGATYGVSVVTSTSRVPRPEVRVSISFGSDPARTDSLVQAVFAELESLKSEGPRESDLAKVRETLVRSRETNLRENGWWLGQLAGAVRDGDPPAAPLEPVLALLTPDALRSAARLYFDNARYVRVTLVPVTGDR
jgi:zinc protease